MKNHVKAIVACMFLMIAAAVVPNVAKAAAPAVPTGLTQAGAGKNDVKITWNAVAGADRYEWSWSPDGVSAWSAGKYDYSTNPGDTIYSLSAGTAYYVRVRAAALDDNYDYEYGAWSQPIQVVTAPDAEQMQMSLADATATSLTVSWTPCPGATSYYVYDGDTNALLGETATPSFVRSGLAPANSYSVKVVPVLTSLAGYKAAATYQMLYGMYTKPNTPVTPAIQNFGLTSIYYNINVAYFGAQDPASTANGYEIEVYTLNGNKKVFTATDSNNRFVVKRNTAYKYRCRFYATYGAEKIYGGWSGYRYMVFQTASGKKYSSRIKMNWKKVAGAKSYTVSISTKEKSGFKKVKTLGKKSSGITITKCGKKKIRKGQKYYVKVVANLMDGKKSVKSDTYFVGNTY